MLKLRDIMTTDVVTITPEMSLRDAMELLAQRHVSGAPVVSGGRVTGVVSAADLLSFVASNPGVPTERGEAPDWGEFADVSLEQEVEEGDTPAGRFFSELWDDAGADVAERIGTIQGPEWNELEEHEVSEVMTRRLWSLPPDESVESAAELMRQNTIHRVLVMDGDRLVGIVSTSDIARAVADHKLTARTYVFNRARDFGRDDWS